MIYFEYADVVGLSLFVFFVKQKTAYEMRISDWSSDVCSSDLAEDHRDAQHLPHVDRGREDGVGELRIGLAEEFDEEARAAIADEEDAGELARIVARLRPPEEEPEHRQQDEPFEPGFRSEEHKSELQSLMRISYAVFCLKKKTNNTKK